MDIAVSAVVELSSIKLGIQMNTRQLEFFLAVAEEGSVARASQRLPLSTSALTRQMQSLESSLGVQLFHRAFDGVTLTAAGKAWLVHARELRKRISDAETQARESAGSASSEFVVSLGGWDVEGIVEKILKEFSSRHPNVKLTIKHMCRDQQVESLRQGEIACAFNLCGLFSPSETLQVASASSEPPMVAVYRDHPLAKKRRVHILELGDESVIVPRELERTPPCFLELENYYSGCRPHLIRQATDEFSYLGLVACRKGLGLVPSTWQRLRFPGVMFRPLDGAVDLRLGMECAYMPGFSNFLVSSLLSLLPRH